MTELEINKALALAIGYQERHIIVQERVSVFHGLEWKTFDYGNWECIGPIAERYNAFPDRCCHGWAAAVGNNLLTWVEADTPQKAIALAVIGGMK